ncbi:uncharacterized protein LOC126671498 [Mercurialis annua]|uniref:uncharacterized protein LOC126654832 n=1 Tax=Mercurialis annua TaxID=3986 RepID=UPI0024AD9722|nr:uncharacterized protein LOC126654832 [Mercurialis annua]XP_055961309.1 uncharacterized protein LOC126671498 [Mercurialis annua]
MNNNNSETMNNKSEGGENGNGGGGVGGGDGIMNWQNAPLHVACLRIATPVDQLPRIDAELAQSQHVVTKYSALGQGLAVMIRSSINSWTTVHPTLSPIPKISNNNLRTCRQMACLIFLQQLPLTVICSRYIIYPIVVQKVPPRIHILSNAKLDSPLRKVQHLKLNFKRQFKKYGDDEIPIGELLEKLMRDADRTEINWLPEIC